MTVFQAATRKLERLYAHLQPVRRTVFSVHLQNLHFHEQNSENLQKPMRFSQSTNNLIYKSNLSNYEKIQIVTLRQFDGRLLNIVYGLALSNKVCFICQKGYAARTNSQRCMGSSGLT